MYEDIRLAILHGRYVPGERLQPFTLAQTFGASTTVVREALTSLAAEAFVTVEPNKGFFVPRLSIEELRDVTTVRCTAESLAITMAIERGDLEWESSVLAIHHQLGRTPRRSIEAPEQLDEEWARVHRLFHATLLEASAVPVLTEWCRSMAAMTELYRRWAAPLPPARGRQVETEHAAIVDAVVARDAPLAAARLQEHYQNTLQVIEQSGLVRAAAG